MTYDTLNCEMSGGVATIAMNRPDRRNALNSTMRADLVRALTALPDTVRCVVLTGSGGAFCSGQDLTEATDIARIEDVLRREYEPMLKAVTDCPVPVIAAVNGVAAGAGANLALAADVVIATESAVFIEAFTRIALIPDAGGTWFVPRLVGRARALGMMLFADPIPARQAAEWGLIYEAVPDDAFAARIAARAAQLAQGPTAVYRDIRKAVDAAGGNDLDAQLGIEAALQGAAGSRPDFREGVAAFLEKRAPRFDGR